jgi:hypothetical protein
VVLTELVVLALLHSQRGDLPHLQVKTFQELIGSLAVAVDKLVLVGMAVAVKMSQVLTLMILQEL